MQLDLGMKRSPALLVQAFVDGPMLSQTMVAWDGVPLAGFARQRAVIFTADKGASAVVRVRKCSEIRDVTERLCRASGMSGFFSVQFIRPEDGSSPRDFSTSLLLVLIRDDAYHPRRRSPPSRNRDTRVS